MVHLEYLRYATCIAKNLIKLGLNYHYTKTSYLKIFMNHRICAKSPKITILNIIFYLLFIGQIYFLCKINKCTVKDENILRNYPLLSSFFTLNYFTKESFKIENHLALTWILILSSCNTMLSCMEPYKTNLYFNIFSTSSIFLLLAVYVARIIIYSITKNNSSRVVKFNENLRYIGKYIIPMNPHQEQMDGLNSENNSSVEQNLSENVDSKLSTIIGLAFYPFDVISSNILFVPFDFKKFEILDLKVKTLISPFIYSVILIVYLGIYTFENLVKIIGGAFIFVILNVIFITIKKSSFYSYFINLVSTNLLYCIFYDSIIKECNSKNSLISFIGNLSLVLNITEQMILLSKFNFKNSKPINFYASTLISLITISLIKINEPKKIVTYLYKRMLMDSSIVSSLTNIIFSLLIIFSFIVYNSSLGKRTSRYFGSLLAFYTLYSLLSLNK